MKIEISIPDLGNNVGTCKWVANELSQIEFEFRTMKYGGIALWYKNKNESKWKWFASPDFHDYLGGAEYSKFQCVDTSTTDNASALFNVPLTPAAKKYTWDFITKVIDEFENQWENDNAINN